MAKTIRNIKGKEREGSKAKMFDKKKDRHDTRNLLSAIIRKKDLT